ncbi:MAG: 3-oxoacyl-[acyl-carrier-protein] reductase [Lachnospiraceae bacterium]|nr:3-oxoacyl-[acyl-carrier-protein] reductase [Lachnospiraceae bacterium]
MRRLEGKVAIVTGASRGIGAATAKKLAGSGAMVIINYCGSAEAASQVEYEIEQLGGVAKSVQCDISDYEKCKEFVDCIYKEYGQIDILINNAGVTRDGLLIGMDEDDFDKVIDTNLKGTFNCMKFVSKYMIKKRSGSIINISSVSGIMGNPGQVNYSASKAGIIGMTKSAAKELAARNIRVNAVAPGFVESNMTDKLPQSVKDEAGKHISLGRFGKPEEIANAVAFLAGDESSYITGQVISVDGGM